MASATTARARQLLSATRKAAPTVVTPLAMTAIVTTIVTAALAGIVTAAVTAHALLIALIVIGTVTEIQTAAVVRLVAVAARPRVARTPVAAAVAAATAGLATTIVAGTVVLPGSTARLATRRLVPSAATAQLQHVVSLSATRMYLVWTKLPLE